LAHADSPAQGRVCCAHRSVGSQREEVRSKKQEVKDNASWPVLKT
jgi:hypothetical protein